MSSADRLIDSAQELLWERGYAATSPREIQRRANAGQGSMYHHFASKHDLAVAAIERNAERLRAAASRQFAVEGSALERIEAYLRRPREVMRGCPIGRLTQDPDVVSDDELRAPVEHTFDWLLGELAGLVAQGQRDGEIASTLDPAQTASAIVAVLQGGYVLAKAAADPAAFDRAIDGLLRLMTTGATSSATN